MPEHKVMSYEEMCEIIEQAKLELDRRNTHIEVLQVEIVTLRNVLKEIMTLITDYATEGKDND